MHCISERAALTLGLKKQDFLEYYYEIKKNTKQAQTVIGKQFEYNTYIRDFFEDNKGASLDDSIECWKYKKSLKGHNKYERSDLKVLEQKI